jgi:hypothetical protein
MRVYGKIELMVLCAFAAFVTGCGKSSSASSPGLEPYTPTKLEWLQVEAQTELSENATCYAVNIAMRRPDTIVVVVPYKRCISEEGARIVAVQDVEAVRILAQGHEWKSWVKVERDVHLLNGDGRE